MIEKICEYCDAPFAALKQRNRFCSRSCAGFGQKTRPPIDRFLAKVEWSDQRYNGTRCLVWIGSTDLHGYGHFRVSNSYRSSAHRWSYKHWVGQIPEGLVIDHLCRNTSCVNPVHLEPVTHAENVRRGIAPEITRARHRKRTHCVHGHEFTPENTHFRKDGVSSRTCRACSARHQREYYRARKIKENR